MKTNDLKKGTRVMLSNGWVADLLDNMKGKIRTAKVYGLATEMGSIYTHDIVQYQEADGRWNDDIEYTVDQIELRHTVQAMRMGR
jgi:predicted transcriptional regulator